MSRDEKFGIWGTFIGLAVGLAIGIGFSQFGYWLTIQRMEREAVDSGKAEFYVDEKEAPKKWRWK